MSHILDQIHEHADGIKTALLGAGGTGATVALQNVNLAVSIIAGVVTIVYVVLKIYNECRKD